VKQLFERRENILSIEIKEKIFKISKDKNFS